jgi:signal transduction histidine kinase
MLLLLAIVAMAVLLFVFLQTQGVTWPNLWIALALLIPAGAAVGYLILSDLAQSKQRQDERLEHLTREIVHEINLPISTIQSNLQMLAVRIDDPHNRKRIERSQEALGRLRRLYDELAYAIRREFHAVEKETFDLADILEERAAIHHELGRNPVEVQAQSCAIHADRIGFEQMLDNVIENAMKYSDADAPIVLHCSQGVLTIRDKGIGMDATQIARIYERYYQGDTHRPGEGIGLALVKRYCDEAGIGIRIESAPGEGTQVVLDLARVIQK